MEHPPSSYKLLYVDDSADLRLRQLLEGASGPGYDVTLCEDGDELNDQLNESECEFHLALVDFNLEHHFPEEFKNGIVVTERLCERFPNLSVIGVTKHLTNTGECANATVDTHTHEWVSAGARWVLDTGRLARGEDWPLTAALLRRFAYETWRRLQPVSALRIDGNTLPDRVLERAAFAAKRGVRMITIRGETGVGKEIVARMITERILGSTDSERFVSVNCAAIPHALFEAEMFGYSKGAFTGAERAHKGYFQESHGGVLFLDEIGELPLEMQPKLLRAIEEGVVRPVGSPHAKPARPAMIVAATNRDLAMEVKEERFRQDLYYRICVLEIEVPPLRDRTEDLRPLIESLLRKKNEHYSRNVKFIDLDAAVDVFKDHFHKKDKASGNVRELENMLERIVVFSLTEEVAEAEITNLTGAQIESMPAEKEIVQSPAKFVEVISTIIETLLPEYKKGGKYPNKKALLDAAIIEFYQKYDVCFTPGLPKTTVSAKNLETRYLKQLAPGLVGKLREANPRK